MVRPRPLFPSPRGVLVPFTQCIGASPVPTWPCLSLLSGLSRHLLFFALWRVSTCVVVGLGLLLPDGLSFPGPEWTIEESRQPSLEAHAQCRRPLG